MLLTLSMILHFEFVTMILIFSLNTFSQNIPIDSICNSYSEATVMCNVLCIVCLCYVLAVVCSVLCDCACSLCCMLCSLCCMLCVLSAAQTCSVSLTHYTLTATTCWHISYISLGRYLNKSKANLLNSTKSCWLLVTAINCKKNSKKE